MCSLLEKVSDHLSVKRRVVSPCLFFRTVETQNEREKAQNLTYVCDHPFPRLIIFHRFLLQ